MGNQITRIALPFQVFVLTVSTLAIGTLNLFQLVPFLVFVFGAGSLADVVDRRRLLMATARRFPELAQHVVRPSDARPR